MRRLHPATWPNALRVVCLVAAGLWLVPLLAMWHKGSRHTWLPYVGIGLWILVLLGALTGNGTDNDPQEVSTTATATTTAQTASPAAVPAVATTTASTSTPAATVSPTPDVTPEPTPTAPPPPKKSDALAGARLTRLTETIKDRDDCHDEAVTGEESWRAGQVVLLKARGVGECQGWLHVNSDDEITWVREEYVANPNVGPAVSEQIGSLQLIVYGVEAYDTTAHNIFNGANIRLIVAISNTGDDVYEMILNTWQLFGSNGIVYDHDSLCTSCPGDLSDVALAPGGSIAGFIYFQTPEGVGFTKMRYAPLFSLNEAELAIP